MLIAVVISSAWQQALASMLSAVVKGIITLLSSTEKVTKVCNSDGQWFHHPESKRVWSNYTLCPAYTKEKRKVAHCSPDVSSQKVRSDNHNTLSACRWHSLSTTWPWWVTAYPSCPCLFVSSSFPTSSEC